MDKEEILQCLQRDFPDAIRNDVTDYTSLKVKKATGKEQNFIQVTKGKISILSRFLTDEEKKIAKIAPKKSRWTIDADYRIDSEEDYQRVLPLIRKSYEGVKGDTLSAYDEFKLLLEEFIRQAEINVRYDSEKNSRFSTKYTEEVNYARCSDSEAITISHHTFYCHLFNTGSYGPRSGEGSSQVPYINLDLGNSIWGNLRFTFEQFKIISIRAVLWTIENKDFKTSIDYSVNDLGLFDGNIANEAVAEFYNRYVDLNNSSAYRELLNKNYASERSHKMSGYAKILEQSKNLILRGAPGTGKTYLAKEIAKELTGGNEEQIGFVQFHPSYDYTDFVEGLRPKLDDNDQMVFKRQDGIFKAFCQKAKDAGRDNFLESWQAFFTKVSEVESGGSYDAVKTLTGKSMHLIGYERAGMTGVTEKNSSTSLFFNMEQCYKVYKGQPGVPQGGLDNYRKAIVQHLKNEFGLKDYIASQSSVSDKKFVFIIDEINRGEISKIFGELFFAIDPGYRGEKGAVTTQYANMNDSTEPFYVPENVYIIGTMNDIDRSVDTFDFAMRRRFRFVEVAAEDSLGMWDGILSEEQLDEAKVRLTKLNQAIEDLEELNRNYHVGPSYFLTLPDLDYDYDTLWKDYLAPLLEEYLRGTYDENEKLEQLQRAYNLEEQANETDG